MSEIFHVDMQFLTNALGVFDNPRAFEQTARSREAGLRASNVATLVDALDFCNLLVLGDRIVFDIDAGGGRQQKVLDQIDRVATSLGDTVAGDIFRDSFAGVAPADARASDSLQLTAARNATAFFVRLARCATNVLDLFHLPRATPSDPAMYLLRHVENGRPPSAPEIEELQSKKEITGRRFYAAMLSDETAFKALCDSRQQVDLNDDVLAVLFMNFRLRLAEERSLTREKVLVGGSNDNEELVDTLAYLPSMGRRDFSREFSRFIRWNTDSRTRNGHSFDLGLQEYFVEEWEGIGCQLQLSERRAIPIIVASVVASLSSATTPRPASLLIECLRWRAENQNQINAIRQATHEFEALADGDRRAKVATYAAEILKSPSTDAALNRSLLNGLSQREKWLGLGIRAVLNPLGALENVVINSTDNVRQHFERTRSPEFVAATQLSEAARPVLAGVNDKVRQLLIDIFGGTVIDARNPNFDPDRFPALV